MIALDSIVGRAAGALSDAATAIGHHPGFVDVAIAATAQIRSLVVLTRTLPHFGPLGVGDPFGDRS